ncbi:immunity 49 family protein [Streptomyces sp. RFCAC02]|uniref:immunity 49 family protein n=1 Tax=Streptomyces sp. RFCAC02 TaxID=2499143 RepID=UPI001020D4BF|nr:immunity 49 family protein [Streptomyces sp. RFCAC02]
MNPEQTPDAGELLRGTYARLLPADSITPDIAGAMRYARVVADGLVFAYALDRPTDVRILTDRDVERVGIEELGRAAYANLMRVPVTHEEIPHEGTILHSFHGDSHFIGSQALFLSAAVKRVTGEELPRAGALVVMPSRHNLVYHPLADGTVVDAVNGLAAYALGAYEDGPGALSPRLYWWHRGSLTSLTVIDEETRSFSVRPPQRLLGLMRGLDRLDRAGRLATRATAAAPAPDTAALNDATADAITGLSDGSTAGLAGAFASAVDLALAGCAADPRAALADTWDGWAVATQLGTALFTGARAQECHLGEDRVLRLPDTPTAPPADARAWLDALYLAVICRNTERISRLCRVPLETLRQDDTVDAYVLHWVNALRLYFGDDDSMEFVAEALGDTMKTSAPDEVTHAPVEFVNAVDYQPVALFHRLITRNFNAFAETLAEALTEHAAYWGESPVPRARVPLGVLAMASLAFDGGFPIDPERQPHLPKYLLNRERIEWLPTP